MPYSLLHCAFPKPHQLSRSLSGENILLSQSDVPSPFSPHNSPLKFVQESASPNPKPVFFTPQHPYLSLAAESSRSIKSGLHHRCPATCRVYLLHQDKWSPQTSITWLQRGFFSCAGAFPVERAPNSLLLFFPHLAQNIVVRSLCSSCLTPCNILLRKVILPWK